MKLRIPPVLVFAIFFGIMYAVSIILPFGDFEFFGRQYLMVFLVGLAMIIAFISLAQFIISKTTVDPLKPSKTSSFVTGGVYKYTRNPMYLALLLVLSACGLWLGNAFNTLLVAGFVGYMNKFQIVPEEEMLLAKFSKEYAKYCVQVRRWF